MSVNLQNQIDSNLEEIIKEFDEIEGLRDSDKENIIATIEEYSKDNISVISESSSDSQSDISGSQDSMKELIRDVSTFIDENTVSDIDSINTKLSFNEVTAEYLREQAGNINGLEDLKDYKNRIPDYETGKAAFKDFSISDSISVGNMGSLNTLINSQIKKQTESLKENFKKRAFEELKSQLEQMKFKEYTGISSDKVVQNIRNLENSETDENLKTALENTRKIIEDQNNSSTVIAAEDIKFIKDSINNEIKDAKAEISSVYTVTSTAINTYLSAARGAFDSGTISDAQVDTLKKQTKLLMEQQQKLAKFSTPLTDIAKKNFNTIFEEQLKLLPISQSQINEYLKNDLIKISNGISSNLPDLNNVNTSTLNKLSSSKAIQNNINNIKKYYKKINIKVI